MTTATRTKYQFPGKTGRQDAERAYRQADQERLRLFWLSAALVDKRVTWGRRHGDYRFGVLESVPHSPHKQPLIVSEFRPNTGQMPSLYVVNETEFREEIRKHYRFGPEQDYVAAAEDKRFTDALTWTKGATP